MDIVKVDSEDSYFTDTVNVERIERWMLDALEYNSGGQHYWDCKLSYQPRQGGNSWSTPKEYETWGDFWEAFPRFDGLNICLGFAFGIDLKYESCGKCAGRGWNALTDDIYEDLVYDFAYGTSGNLSDDEIEYMVKNSRLNVYYQQNPIMNGESEITKVKYDDGWLGYCHIKNEWVKIHAPYIPRVDEIGNRIKNAISISMLARYRAHKRGVYGECPRCGGSGKVKIGKNRLQLKMLIFHPNRNAIRGVLIRNISQMDISSVISYLRNGKTVLENEIWGNI